MYTNKNIKVSFDEAKIHLFDKETGDSILKGAKQ